MFAKNQTLRLLITLVGGGDRPAFRRLYALLAPETLLRVHGDVPEPGHAEAVVRATFCEVWWMCGSDRHRSAPCQDVPQWIAGIAARRGAERRTVLNQIGGDASSTGRSASFVGMLAGHDLLMARELMAMLDGPDTVLTRPCAA